MQSIEVIFPKRGIPRVVNGECPVVRTGEYVEWVFHSANPKLDVVEIEFQDEKAEFFPNETEKHKRREKVGPHKNAVILGRVPYDKPGYPCSIHDKYTIRGYVTEGEPLVNDPEIFTKKP